MVHRNFPRWLRCAAVLAIALSAAPLTGCRDNGDITGSIGEAQQPLPSGDTALRVYTDSWGARYDADPGSKLASINYSRGLRALTRSKEAVAVMQSAAVKSPNDYDILGAYGKALADDGQLIQARDVLTRSYTPERPNWAIMSVQGSIADQLGDHQAAQEFYRGALKIAPGEPNVLSNLGLSYALDKQLPAAEASLRQAAADPRADRRVRDNLALVLALQGKFKEAEQINLQDMSPAEASANIAAVKRMIAQSGSWKDIQALDAKRRSAKGAPPAPTG